MAQRGERVAAVRAALELTAPAFIERITDVALRYGAKISLDASKLSRLEGGTRQLTAAEATIIALLDPQERGTTWLVFGDRTRAKAEMPERRTG